MSTIKINNPVKQQFSMVPNSLWSLDISCTAKAIVAYLLSLQDGSTVRVAQIEDALQIGRDKRRNAMREIMATGDPFEDAGKPILLFYHIEKTSENRIVTKQLQLDTSPLLCNVLNGKSLPPENPPSPTLPPENPTVGKSGPLGRDFRATRGGKSGPLYNTNIKTHPAGLNLNDLGKYARACLKAGNPVPLGNGKTLHPSTQEYSHLSDLLRKERADL